MKIYKKTLKSTAHIKNNVKKKLDTCVLVVIDIIAKIVMPEIIMKKIVNTAWIKNNILQLFAQ
jgi:hypothetical protein